jgi:Septum formation
VEGGEPSLDLLGEDRPVNRSLAAGLATVTLLLAGCSGGDDSSGPAAQTTSTPTPTTSAVVKPPAPPPTDGCYELSDNQLTRLDNDSSVVACKASHTTQTIHVGRLDLVVRGHALAVDSDAARKQLSTECPQRFETYVGGTAEQRDLSRLRVVWFAPSVAQGDLGAEWFRCDIVAFGRGDSLQPETAPIAQGVLDTDAGRERYGLCGTAAPGAADFERVLCSMDHTWRALATIPLSGDRYPGTDAVKQAGDSDCQDKVRAAEGFTLKFTYGWEWPTQDQWDAGQHFGYCWQPTQS